MCVLPLNRLGPQIRSVCGGSQKQCTRTHTTGIYSFLNWCQHGSVCPFHVSCMHEQEIYILRPNYFTLCRCKNLLNQNTCLFVFVKIIFIEWKEMLNLKRKFTLKWKMFILFSHWPLLYTLSIMKMKENCVCKASEWQKSNVKLLYLYKIFQALAIRHTRTKVIGHQWHQMA